MKSESVSWSGRLLWYVLDVLMPSGLSGGSGALSAADAVTTPVSAAVRLR